MNTRVRALQELVRESRYSVDETAVASAIIVRARARRMGSEAPYHSEPRARMSAPARLRSPHD
jgi:hypothetical protein